MRCHGFECNPAQILRIGHGIKAKDDEHTLFLFQVKGFGGFGGFAA